MHRTMRLSRAGHGGLKIILPTRLSAANDAFLVREGFAARYIDLCPFAWALNLLLDRP